MYRDICLTNSESITRWLDEYMATLGDLRRRIATHDKDLNEQFGKAREVRLQWQADQDMSR